jgi:hypothetical protein
VLDLKLKLNFDISNKGDLHNRENGAKIFLKIV